MNPLINNNGNHNQTQGQINSFEQLYAQAMKNPAAMLSQLGIPQNITTPQGAVQYLLQSGKVTQSQIEQAQRKAAQIQRKQSI